MVDGSDLGRWLIERQRRLDRAQAEWLEHLAEFDRSEAWALDGQLSCASWMVLRMGMARSTAFERLQVAHALERRPVIAAAFREGRLSYSAVRLLARMDWPSQEVDEAAVALAEAPGATIADIERLVRTYDLYVGQEVPPPPPEAARQIRIRRNGDGTGRIVITLTELELAEFAAALQAFVDLRYRSSGPVDESAVADTPTPPSSSPATPLPADAPTLPGPVDESAVADIPTSVTARADAFMDLVNAGLAAADGGRVAGDDRYLVHLVSLEQRATTFVGGTPVHPGAAGAVGCDCSSVEHATTDAGEPLRLGRRSRQWSTAQRRAVSVRDGGHCRFPGCTSTFYDIHHIQAWEHDGPTDVANGMCCCRRHHRLIHGQGFKVEGDANAELVFCRPDGTLIDVSFPVSRPLLSVVDIAADR